MKIILYFILGLLFFPIVAKAQYANDQCSGAIALTLGTADVCTAGTFSVNTATNDPTTQPSCWSFANNDGVWYKFTATATNVYIELNDNGVTYTPMIALYDGGASPGTCPNTAATPIAGGCLDYTTNNAVSEFTGLTIGNTYYILADMPSTISQNFCINAYNAPSAVTAGTACPASANTTVALSTCADIGTPTLESNGAVVTFSQAGGATPSPAPSCAGGTVTNGSWVRYDLAAGVTAITMNWESEFGGSAANGSANINAAFYQGGTCATLSQISCQTIGSFSAGVFSVGNLVVQGLDPSQDLWMYVYRDDNKAFTLPYDIVGSATPANDACSSPSAATSSITGCNLGALGDDWSGSTLADGPEQAFAGGSAATCSGTAAWGSNENTVWYTFQAQATTATINVANITCNELGTGIAQFGVFTSCACPTTANYSTNACFKGCSTGTTAINLTGLTVGETLYLAFDGSAGDVCKLDFIYTDIIPLNVNWIDFYAKKQNNKALLFWSTDGESNADRFEVERSDNAGETFFTVGVIKASGTSNELRKYEFGDVNLKSTMTFYRLKQVDYNNESTYSKIINVNHDLLIGEPIMNFDPIANQIQIYFDDKYIESYTVNLYNIMGQQNQSLKKYSFDDVEKATISTSELSSGIYVVEITSKNGNNRIVKKISISQ